MAKSIDPADKTTKDPYVNPKDLQGVKKPPLHLVAPVSVLHEAMAMLDGAQKYGPFNWRDKRVVASIYVAAAKRHIDLWFEGEQVAQDSGVHHLGHAKACLGIILDAEAMDCLIDDRPNPCDGAYAKAVAAMEALIASKKEK